MFSSYCEKLWQRNKLLAPPPNRLRQHALHRVTKHTALVSAAHKERARQRDANSRTRRSSIGNAKAMPYRAPIDAQFSVRSARWGLDSKRSRFLRASGPMPTASGSLLSRLAGRTCVTRSRR